MAPRDDGGVLGGRPQYEVFDARGRLIGRVDLGWPVERLAVEYEGDHHRERDQFQKDIGRVNALRSVGWTVLRLAADDIIRRPRETVTLVAQHSPSAVDQTRLVPTAVSALLRQRCGPAGDRGLRP